jgi:hypothetical protein
MVGMFLLPIAKQCPVKLYKSLLDAGSLKFALSLQENTLPLLPAGRSCLSMV